MDAMKSIGLLGMAPVERSQMSRWKQSSTSSRFSTLSSCSTPESGTSLSSPKVS